MNKLIILVLITYAVFISFQNKYKDKLENYYYYLKRVKNANISLNKNLIINNPFFSIIIIVYNMEKYLDRVITSILNQSFQNFEIIIIDDCSTDNSRNIIKKYELLQFQIKAFFHSKNLGIYTSRVDGFMHSIGNYIIYVDPDDIIINKNLLQIIYNFNLKYNLDIIEFKVIYHDEEQFNIYISQEQELNHFHAFNKHIISHPELSNIIFYYPRTNEISHLICRSIWNKAIRRNVIFKSINFIGEIIYKAFNFNIAEDTILNILNFQFASNYSNIDIEGYLYTIRKKSASHGDIGLQHEIIKSKSILTYFQLFVKYIDYFNKDRNFFSKEYEQLNYYLFFLIKNDLSEKKEVYKLLKEFLPIYDLFKILSDLNVSVKDLKDFFNFV
jgi:glycosyltransferase involved in cell wall biosynthesis